jgi:hypothetical protein
MGPECVMPTSEDYRRYAEECFSLARRAKGEAQQLLFLEMADVWLQVASLANRIHAEPSLPRSTDNSA